MVAENGDIVEERKSSAGRRKTDMRDWQTIIRTLIGAVAAAGIVAAASFTWSTYSTTNKMESKLSQICDAYPELKERVNKMDVEIQTNRMGYVETRTRVFFLEKKAEELEKRMNNRR